MKTSVAMTTYNGALFVERQLESILAQSQCVDEVMIVDDGSTDQTADIVQSFIDTRQLSHWHFSVNTSNIGYTQNFYRAISQCTHELIFLSDQDDHWRENKVAIMSAYFDQDSTLNSLASSFAICDSDDHPIQYPVANPRLSDNYQLESFQFKNLVMANTIRGCTMAFRKQVLTDEPLYPFQSGFLGHDWLINVLASLKGKTLGLNAVLMDYRVHEHNTSFSTTESHRIKSTKAMRLLGVREQQAALAQLLDHSSVSTTQRHQMKRQIQFAHQREQVLAQRNLWVWSLLCVKLHRYKAIYGTYRGAIKVWIGDFIYSFKK